MPSAAYNKYNKLKKGQTYLQEQIAITKMRYPIFEGLLEQLDQADFNTASEIRQELIHQGYLKDQKIKRIVPGGKRKRNCRTFQK